MQGSFSRYVLPLLTVHCHSPFAAVVGETRSIDTGFNGTDAHSEITRRLQAADVQNYCSGSRPSVRYRTFVRSRGNAGREDRSRGRLRHQKRGEVCRRCGPPARVLGIAEYARRKRRSTCVGAPTGFNDAGSVIRRDQKTIHVHARMIGLWRSQRMTARTLTTPMFNRR